VCRGECGAVREKARGEKDSLFLDKSWQLSCAGIYFIFAEIFAEIVTELTGVPDRKTLRLACDLRAEGVR
jgi:hypothetical protein